MKRKNCRIIGLCLACMALLFAVSGCRQLTAPQQTQKSNGQVQARRIVSLTLSADEILLTALPPERIIAVTYLADDPGVCNVVEQAKLIPNKLRANAEAVIALHPDLVIAAEWQGEGLIRTLRDAGLRVYVYDAPNSVEGVENLILSMLTETGDAQTGRRMVDEMQRQLQDVRSRVEGIPPESQPVVLWHSLTGMSGGAGTLFDDMARYAGVVNGASQYGLKLSEVMPKEAVLKVNPDLVLLPTWDWQGRGNTDAVKTELTSDPALAGVKAIRNQRLAAIPEKYLYSSSQQLVKGVRALAEAAYPERF